VWSPEGDRVVFASDRDGPQNIYVIGVGDTAEERLLHESDVTFRSPNAWSSGPQAAQWIVVTQQEPQVNLWLLSPASGEMKPFLTRPFPEAAGRLDPTGQWLAYLSAESDRMEVHLQSFPEPGQKVQVTRQGAFVPTWLADGRLLFRGPEQLSIWEVPLGSGATQPGTPRQLATFPVGTMWIEPLVDGRFLSIVPESSDGVTVSLVRNWLEALPGR
jgi:Tol biopolymer transport system component